MTRRELGFWLGVLITAAVILATIVVESADASTVISGGSNPAGYQSWVDAVTRVPTPTTGVEVLTGVEDCGPGTVGCTPNPWTIKLTAYATRKTFLHELGHIEDDVAMTDGDRAAFIEIIGHTRYTWWDVGRGDHLLMAGEWYADVYSICAGAKRLDRRWWYSVQGGLLAGWRVQRACGLISWADAH